MVIQDYISARRLLPYNVKRINLIHITIEQLSILFVVIQDYRSARRLLPYNVKRINLINLVNNTHEGYCSNLLL